MRPALFRRTWFSSGNKVLHCRWTAGLWVVGSAVGCDVHLEHTRLRMLAPPNRVNNLVKDSFFRKCYTAHPCPKSECELVPTNKHEQIMNNAKLLGIGFHFFLAMVAGLIFMVIHIFLKLDSSAFVYQAPSYGQLWVLQLLLLHRWRADTCRPLSRPLELL